MDTAPIVEFQPDGSINDRDYEKIKRAWDLSQRQGDVDRYHGIICALCDAPFEQHSHSWRCPRPVAPRFKFPAIAMEASTAGETEGLDPKDDSAGPKDIAQPIPESHP
jgi:hypothetical protein